MKITAEKAARIVVSAAVLFGIGFVAHEFLSKKKPIEPSTKTTPDITATIPQPSQVCTAPADQTETGNLVPFTNDIADVIAALGGNLSIAQIEEGPRGLVQCNKDITAEDMATRDAASKIATDGLERCLAIAGFTPSTTVNPQQQVGPQTSYSTVYVVCVPPLPTQSV